MTTAICFAVLPLLRLAVGLQSWRRPLQIVAIALVVWLVTGCMSMTPSVHVETSAPRAASVPAVAPAPPTAGAIYASSNFRPMFENRRARFPGDILTVKIAEKISASKSSNSKIDRTGSIEGTIGALPFSSARVLGKTAIRGGSENNFEGKGETGSDNVFTGDITVTVVEQLANGNLVVAGEKQVGLNGNVDTLKFSGVVSPDTITPDNTVLSTRVADARLDFSGRGAIGEAQVMGWLSRFFLSFLPI